MQSPDAIAERSSRPGTRNDFEADIASPVSGSSSDESRPMLKQTDLSKSAKRLEAITGLEKERSASSTNQTFDTIDYPSAPEELLKSVATDDDGLHKEMPTITITDEFGRTYSALNAGEDLLKKFESCTNNDNGFEEDNGSAMISSFFRDSDTYGSVIYKPVTVPSRGIQAMQNKVVEESKPQQQHDRSASKDVKCASISALMNLLGTTQPVKSSVPGKIRVIVTQENTAINKQYGAIGTKESASDDKVDGKAENKHRGEWLRKIVIIINIFNTAFSNEIGELIFQELVHRHIGFSACSDCMQLIPYMDNQIGMTVKTNTMILKPVYYYL